MRLNRTLLAMALWMAVVMALPARAAALPPIKHVFIIVFENKGFHETYGNTSKAPYLAHTLTGHGQLLANYYGTAHVSPPNYLAMISGQGPNPQTQADCLNYTDFSPGTTMDADGQAIGQGCVYPSTVRTIADQLVAKGLTWKGYMEDMGNSTKSKTCRHPAIGAMDDTTLARTGDEYATRHNPFVYFHSIIDSPACDANDVPLDRLAKDLHSMASTPNYAFIVPNLCNDAHDPSETSTGANCKTDGKPGGLVRVDPFLKTWVPRILGSPAYKQDGLLMIVFDEARWSTFAGGSFDSDAQADASFCCDELMGPNTLNAGGPIPGGGGGLTGAVLLSPWVRGGWINATPYNHYSQLRTVEDLFGLSHLGFAARPELKAFGNDVFNGPGPGSGASHGGGGGAKPCTERTLPKPRRGKFSRGTLILSVKKTFRGDRTRLEMRFSHGASVDISADPRGSRPPRRIGPTSVRSCKTYRTTLPRGSGHAAINATSSGGSELRQLRY